MLMRCGGQDLNKASLEEALSRTLSDITIIPFFVQKSLGGDGLDSELKSGSFIPFWFPYSFFHFS